MTTRSFFPRLCSLAGVLALSISCSFCSAPSQSNSAIVYSSAPAQVYIMLPSMPSEMDFSGEPVPLKVFDVRESLQKELIVNMNFHSSTLQWLIRAGRYFPVIVPILREEGVPEDFKFLCLIESDLVNKVSAAGATGYWQLMKASGTQLGLEITTEVDERYHLEKSTRAACSYLKDMYRTFGSWTMAAASYNVGKTGLTTSVKKQRTSNYYDLLLNEETARYVFRILAAKVIMNDPERYGFHVDQDAIYKPIPYTTVEVTGKVPSFTQFALDNGTSYKLLKVLNPWLRDTFLTNKSGAVYQIQIPESGFRESLPAIGAGAIQ